MTNQRITAVPTKHGARDLGVRLRLYTGQLRQRGTIGLGVDVYHVYLWAKQSQPDIDEWNGVPVVYHIGGGRPKAT